MSSQKAKAFVFKISRPILIGLFCVSVIHCAAEPTEEDVERARSEFLIMRFQAPFVRELRGRSDMELMQMVCRSKNLDCDALLKRIEESDPQFYQQLQSSQN
ncbi:MAG: hypothetical protein KDK30_02490 [Leptospiraceae bacterium]|nr:hypothetical protein [Leptospiraceae bacterium]